MSTRDASIVFVKCPSCEQWSICYSNQVTVRCCNCHKKLYLDAKRKRPEVVGPVSSYEEAISFTKKCDDEVLNNWLLFGIPFPFTKLLQFQHNVIRKCNLLRFKRLDRRGLKREANRRYWERRKYRQFIGDGGSREVTPKPYAVVRCHYCSQLSLADASRGSHYCPYCARHGAHGVIVMTRIRLHQKREKKHVLLTTYDYEEALQRMTQLRRIEIRGILNASNACSWSIERDEVNVFSERLSAL